MYLGDNVVSLLLKEITTGAIGERTDLAEICEPTGKVL